MTMSENMTLFGVVQRGLSAQMVRMNAAASNLSNAGSVAKSEGEAYRPIRTVFRTEMDKASGLATVRVESIQRSDVAAIQQYDPDHPLADEDGNIWLSPVDETSEMVEVMESARQYQNLVQAMQTAKQLMIDTMRTR